MRPVPQGLPIHAADPRRIGPAHPVVDRRDREQPPRLVGILNLSASRRTNPASKSSRNRTEAINLLPCHEERESLFGLQGNP